MMQTIMIISYSGRVPSVANKMISTHAPVLDNPAPAVPANEDLEIQIVEP